MKGCLLPLAFSAAIATFACAAQAEKLPYLYIGGNLASGDYAEEGGDLDLPFAYGRVGVLFSEMFAIELRYGEGIDDDTATVPPFGNFAVEVDEMKGAYLRVGKQLGDYVYPYALVGRSKGTLRVSQGGISATADDSDTSYGVGLDIGLPGTRVQLNVEYMQYIDAGDVEFSALSIGILGYF